ncbi:MAG: HK97 family phage prohead protease [Candidatus Xenobia bacterium]
MTLIAPRRRAPLPTVGQREHSHCLGKIQAVDDNAHTITAIVSTINVDRGDDIILPRAYEKRIGSYLRNPMHLWGHKQDLPQYCIGRALPDSIKILSNGLLVTFLYDVEDDFANSVYGKYVRGILNAYSVGVDPFDWVLPAKASPDILDLLAQEQVDPDLARVIYTDVELWEVSACGVPMNRESLVIGRSVNMAAESDTWKVCGSRSLTVDDKDTWDKGKAEESLGDDLALWKKAHVLQSGDGTKKGDFHLPFAMKVGDELKAIKAGVQACAGAHGVDAVDGVPDDVREKAKSLIEVYYHKFDQKAPWETKEDAGMPQLQKTLDGKGDGLVTRLAPTKKAHPVANDITSRLYAVANNIAQAIWSWDSDDDNDAPPADILLGSIPILEDIIDDMRELGGGTPTAAPGAASVDTSTAEKSADKLLAVLSKLASAPKTNAGAVLSAANVEHLKAVVLHSKEAMASSTKAVERVKQMVKDAGADLDSIDTDPVDPDETVDQNPENDPKNGGDDDRNKGVVLNWDLT